MSDFHVNELPKTAVAGAGDYFIINEDNEFTKIINFADLTTQLVTDLRLDERYVRLSPSVTTQSISNNLNVGGSIGIGGVPEELLSIRCVKTETEDDWTPAQIKLINSEKQIWKSGIYNVSDFRITTGTDDRERIYIKNNGDVRLSTGGLSVSGGATGTNQFTYSSSDGLRICDGVYWGITVKERTVKIGVPNNYTNGNSDLTVSGNKQGTMIFMYDHAQAHDKDANKTGIYVQFSGIKDTELCDDLISFHTNYDSESFNADDVKGTYTITGDVVGFRGSGNTMIECDGKRVNFEAFNWYAEDSFAFYSGGTADNYFKGKLVLGDAASAGWLGDYSRTGWGHSISSGPVMKCSRSKDANTLVIGKQTQDRDPATTANEKIVTFAAGGPTDTGNTLYAAIATDGSGGITMSPTSDYRTKENVTDLGSVTDIIKSLRPVNYNYTWAPGTSRIGFIAHELQEHIPTAVTGMKDAVKSVGTIYNWDGSVYETEADEPTEEELTYTDEVPNEAVPMTDDGEVTMMPVTRQRTWTSTGTKEVHQTVDYSKIVPVLTKALQEALARIEALEAAAGL